MSICPKRAALQACRRRAKIDQAPPQPFSSQPGLPPSIPVLRRQSVMREDAECRPEELENGFDWCRHDRYGQRKTGAVDG